MTDRRGRLLVVALVVFALAIGILLGSGPLRSALTGESSSANHHLQGDLAQAQAGAEAAAVAAGQGEDFADAVGPPAVAGRLADHVVALVRTADVTDADVATATSRLADAGVSVGATVSLTEQWTSEDRAPFRDELAQQITDSLTNPPQGTTSSQVLAAALAQSLAPGVAAGDDLVGADAQERGDTLWSLLTQAELVEGTRDASADLFVLVTAGGDTTDLCDAFEATSNGTVVGSVGPDAGKVGAGSSVTNAASFYGAWAVTGAMVEALNGGAGAYDASDADELIGMLSE